VPPRHPHETARRQGEGSATLDEIAESARGLICITATPTSASSTSSAVIIYMAKLQRHFHRGEEAENQAIVDRSRALGIPIVATTASPYATPPQRELLDVFTCVRNHVTLASAGRLLERNSERH